MSSINYGQEYSKEELLAKIQHMSPKARRRYGKKLVDNPMTSACTWNSWMSLWNERKDLFKDSKAPARTSSGRGNIVTLGNGVRVEIKVLGNSKKAKNYRSGTNRKKRSGKYARTTR